MARLTLDAVIDPTSGLPQLQFNKSATLPTIRIAPGDTIALTLHNMMPVERNHENSINMHFHGLQVEPKAPGDETISTLARSGQTLHYLVRVPANHEPGLYWYHPHTHGESFRQVRSGMSGAIVVEGIQFHLPALRKMTERVMVLRNEPIPRNGRLSVQDGDEQPSSQPSKNPKDPCRPEPGFYNTINGQRRPAILMDPGESQFFRVVNASAGRYYDLRLIGARFRIVELDGVPIDAYPRNPTSYLVDHVVIPPAGRAEFVVAAPEHPSVLMTQCFQSGDGGDPDPSDILAYMRPRDPSKYFVYSAVVHSMVRRRRTVDGWDGAPKELFLSTTAGTGTSTHNSVY